MPTYSLTELNNSTQTDFVTALAGIFEHTPMIAEVAWHLRPFSSVADLHQTMVAVVQEMSPLHQLALIQAHPSLGSKVRMAEASVQEQAAVGLDQLTPAEYQHWLALNERYQTQFGFPFIIAVKLHTKSSILAAFEQRLQNSVAQEHQQALREISEIARLRLIACVQEASSAKPNIPTKD